MSTLENNDLKILIDALKYTSNIVVSLTDKLAEQDKKINKLENTISKIKSIIVELNLKINEKTQKSKINNNSDNEKISSFIINKLSNNNINNNNNILNDKNNILKDKNKIDKLINNIIKKKHIIEENNKEKSLLTDYNITNNNQNTKSNTKTNIDFTVKTAITNNNDDKDNNNNDDKDNNNKNLSKLQNIRRKTNFIRKF